MVPWVVGSNPTCRPKVLQGNRSQRMISADFFCACQRYAARNGRVRCVFRKTLARPSQVQARLWQVQASTFTCQTLANTCEALAILLSSPYVHADDVGGGLRAGRRVAVGVRCAQKSGKIRLENQRKSGWIHIRSPLNHNH